jgi:hypothetical protein
MAAAAREQINAKTNVESAAFRAAQAQVVKPHVCADDDGSSWGDGSSTDEV